MPRPRISCILVDDPARPERVRDAIDDFRAQTYPAKELVVVATTERVPALRLRRDDVRIDFPDKTPLGVLLDTAQRAAAGPLICRWESSCRHHPDRVERQFGVLGRLDTIGCCLSEQLYYDPARRKVYWAHSRIADTLLCWRRAGAAHAPDGDAEPFLQAMSRFGGIANLPVPDLTARLAPTNDPDGMARFWDSCRRTAVGCRWLLEFRRDLTQSVAEFGWDDDGPVSACDEEGHEAYRIGE